MSKIAPLSCTVLALLVLIIGCVGGEIAPTGTAAEIADKVFAESGVSFRMAESLSLAEDEKKEFYLGSTEYPEFADSVVVSPMIRVDTRLLVVLKLAGRGDVETTKIKLEENIDPRRLVCVTFKPEDVAIESRDDVVFMTINSDAEQRNALLEAFRTLE